MNATVQDIMERFDVTAEAALRIYSRMDIDFSECTKAELNAEELRAYEQICNEEMARPMNAGACVK